MRLLVLRTDPAKIKAEVPDGRHTVEYRETRSNKRLHISSSYEAWCGALFNELIDHKQALAVVCSLSDMSRMGKSVRAMLAVHGIDLEIVGGDFDSLREANGDELFASRRWGRAQLTDCAHQTTPKVVSCQKVV